MRRAYGQATAYVPDLPADHRAPPFVLVVDVGYVIEVFADFSGQGRNYTQFPDRRSFAQSRREIERIGGRGDR